MSATRRGIRTVVIVDQPHRRDPMQYELYQFLGASTRMRFLHYDGASLPPCDALFLGFNYSEHLDALAPAMTRVPVILDNNDIECLVADRRVEALFRSGCVHLLFTKYYPSAVLDEFARSVGFSPSRICLVPWACDPATYTAGGEKDIDVCYPVTVAPTWKFHRHRPLIAEIVRNTPNSFVGNVYGAEYLEILRRSKILVVDGSDRHAMTQKYVEGAMSGCLLIGDVPTVPEVAARLFVGGKTMASTHDDWSTLGGVIRAMIEDDTRRLEMASACRAAVAAEFVLARWGERMQDDILRVLEW